MAAVSVTEMEVLDGETILGEKENLTDGLKRQLLADPRGRRIHLPLQQRRARKTKRLTVSGKLKSEDSPEVEKAIAQYREYLEENTAELSAENGCPSSPRSLPATSPRRKRCTRRHASPTSGSSRWPSPSATSTCASTRAKTMCRRANSKASTGSRKRSGRRTPPRAWRRSPKKLMANVEELEAKVKTVDLQAVQIANGANELLGEVSASKITGEEERYSHIDLVDFKANVEGSSGGHSNLSSRCSAPVTRRWRRKSKPTSKTSTRLKPLAKPPTGSSAYTDLTKADTRKMAQSDRCAGGEAESGAGGDRHGRTGVAARGLAGRTGGRAGKQAPRSSSAPPAVAALARGFGSRKVVQASRRWNP